MENKKIEIIWDSVVEDVVGNNKPKNVKGIKVKNLKTNKVDEIKLDGLFIAIGHDPATQLFKDQFICVSIKNNIWYEYINHRWFEIDSGNTLRLIIYAKWRFTE